MKHIQTFEDYINEAKVDEYLDEGDKNGVFIKNKDCHEQGDEWDEIFTLYKAYRDKHDGLGVSVYAATSWIKVSKLFNDAEFSEIEAAYNKYSKKFRGRMHSSFCRWLREFNVKMPKIISKSNLFTKHKLPTKNIDGSPIVWKDDRLNNY